MVIDEESNTIYMSTKAWDDYFDLGTSSDGPLENITGQKNHKYRSFSNRFSAGEAAAMWLMLAACHYAKESLISAMLLYAKDSLISNAVSEKAPEAFEDPGLVRKPGTIALSNT